MTAADRPSVTDNARAEAWDKGFDTATRNVTADREHQASKAANPYRQTGYEADAMAAGRAETTTDDATQRLARAAYAVDSAHHFHVNSAGRPICTCGFVGDARARTQTEHITAAVLEEYDHD